MTVLGDLAYDAAVSDLEPARLVADRDELDAGADADAGPDAGGEQGCTTNIHVSSIGQGMPRLDLFRAGRSVPAGVERVRTSAGPVQIRRLRSGPSAISADPWGAQG